MMRARRIGGPALLALALAAAGAGCNTYSYLQVHVKLDETTFTSVRRATIHTCHLFVTGAATTDTQLTNCSPPPTFDVGTFDFSTFADAGTVNFDLQMFQGVGEGDANKIGDGMTSVTISSGSTAMGEITVMYTGTGPP